MVQTVHSEENYVIKISQQGKGAFREKQEIRFSIDQLKALQRNFYHVRNLLRVFSLLQPSRPSFYIVNTDTEGGPGLHWTSIFVTKDTCCEFFDSLVNPPGQYSDNFVDF